VEIPYSIEQLLPSCTEVLQINHTLGVRLD
jgi:hypothetical protein